MDLRMIDLAKLNTATKYPSIPTYHALGDRGALLEDGGIALGDDFIATEKVDGTNTRIILTADSQFLIGSREELLHARGDLVYNPALGIVDATREIAEHVVAQADLAIPSDAFLVLYGETFGGKITAMSKQYTGRRSVGFRAFDACVVPQTILAQDRAAISGWRDQGGQEFKNEALLSELADRCGVKLTPRIAVTGALPTGTHD
ncbi:MAG: RNA ligase family protein, partial [Myxococcota bacterium]